MTTDKHHIITFDKVNKWYGNNFHVLRDIDLHVKKGERILLHLYWDDADTVPMGSGYTLSVFYNGSVANSADSSVTFTETITFQTELDTAASHVGEIITGITKPLDVTNALYATTAGNGMFVAVGSEIYSTTHPTGTWTSRTYSGGILKSVAEPPPLMTEESSCAREGMRQ